MQDLKQLYLDTTDKKSNISQKKIRKNMQDLNVPPPDLLLLLVVLLVAVVLVALLVAGC